MKRLLFLLLLCCAPLRAQSLINNAQSNVLVTCLARGANGELFAGTDDVGLWRRDARGVWAVWAGATELGDGNIACLAVDRANRVWVGTAGSGLCVWTGQAWMRYGAGQGPLCARVNALRVADDGSMWGASDAGVFRWNEATGWSYPGVFSGDEATREAARRPIYALSLDKAGRVLEATDDGLDRLTPGENGEAKIEALGRASSPVQPPRAEGGGFLPGPVHDVALDTLGHLWCATRWGVCHSRDDGKTWTFLRGRDWRDNVAGSAVPLALEQSKPLVDLLAEDWVTTLAPTPDGKMWLGFRGQGAEERDSKTFETLVSTQDDAKTIQTPWGDAWVSAILPLAPDQALFARYGGGLFTLFGSAGPLLIGEPKPGEAPAPGKATFSSSFLRAVTEALAQRAAVPVGSGAFYALDRQTRGDWPLRYGRNGMELMGMNDERFTDSVRHWFVTTGPHRVGAEADCFVFTAENNARNPNAPQVPRDFQRRTSEINDGTWQGEKYPASFDGPDLWMSFSLPEGLYRVALYWFNKDGLTGPNRRRDHRVLLYADGATPAECLTKTPLASARLWSGWNGEYAALAVRGPGKFQMRIARDRSFGTILQGVFFDRLGVIPVRPAWLPDSYELLLPPEPPQGAPYADAFALWRACDAAESRGVPCPLERLVALRAASDTGAPAVLLRSWRVQAALWDEGSSDRRDVALPNAPEAKTTP